MASNYINYYVNGMAQSDPCDRQRGEFLTMGVLDRKRPPPDLASQIEAAVAKALGQQAKAAPARQPAKLAGVLHALHATSAPARPKPQLTSIALQRDANGKISAISIAGTNGSRHTLAAQRDAIGRMRSIVIDDRSVWLVQRGYDNQISGLVPMESDK